MRKRLPIFLGLLLLAIATWLLLTNNPAIVPWLERLDNLGYDLQLRTRVLTNKQQSDGHVAIIDIDDASLAAEGRWPWSRAKIAQLINKLNEQGAVVIAFDIFFSEKEPNIAEEFMAKLQQEKTPIDVTLANTIKANISLFDTDAIFAKSLSASTAVLAFSFLPREEFHNSLPKPILEISPELANELHIRRGFGYIANIPLLQAASQGSGFINIYPDADGIIRRAPLIMEYGSNIYASLSLQAVIQYLGTSDINLITPQYDEYKKLEAVTLGAKVIPTDEYGQVLIPFIGRSYTFPFYSATKVLHDQLPADALVGKIVFVGTSATGLGDLQATSIQNPFPGVEIQATLVNGILDIGFSYVPPWALGAILTITIVLGLIGAIWFTYLGPRTLGIIIVFFPMLILFINNIVWTRTGLVISLLMPVILITLQALLNIIYGYLFETRKREHLKEMFGQYVPEKHIDEMIKHAGKEYALKGEDREMSVLFADIRSFTTISEGMSASDLVDMLNTFFTPMTEIIFRHRGTIDKYVGDLIMAFWGAPLKDRHHARHAIQSALEMQRKVKELRPILAEHKWPEIHIGIGINSGSMSVGDMGSRYRRNYTVLGDSVNLASRVEGLSKFYGVDIIVTESTRHNQTRFTFRQLDVVRVKGKKTGVGIYEVICVASQTSTELKQELETYHKALELYFAQKWDEAYVLMEELHQSYPDTRIYQLYIERIKEFKEHPLPEDWDGVYVHLTK